MTADVAGTLVLKVGRLFTGRELLRDVRVVVTGDTIVGVEPCTAPVGANHATAAAGRVLSFPDATMLPGLIDAHVHLSLLARAALKASRPAGGNGHGSAQRAAAPDAEALLAAAVQVADEYLARGVTTIRDLGDRQRLNLRVCQALAERAANGRPGPRLLAPGRALYREGLYGSFMGAAATGKDSLLALGDEELDAGADFVKVIASGIIDFQQASVSAPVPFTPEELRALVDHVHARGKPVAAHASGAAGVAAAVAGGADFLEHGFFAEDGAGSPVAAFKRGDCTWVPTFIPVEVVAAGAALTDLTDGERAGVRGIVQRHAATLRAVHEAGGVAITGSDSGSPGVWEAGGVIGELRCFQRAGLPLRAVLAMATQRAAQALGIGHLTGSIEPGKRADLLVVAGNPLESLDALSDVRLVLRDGVPVYETAAAAPRAVARR